MEGLVVILSSPYFTDRHIQQSRCQVDTPGIWTCNTTCTCTCTCRRTCSMP